MKEEGIENLSNMDDEERETSWPNLKKNTFEITSEDTPKYNCITWALDPNLNRWIAPIEKKGYYWPSDLPPISTIENYIKLCKKFGYEICENGSFERGFEKIAIYFKEANLETIHIARQRKDGTWTSKLGDYEDIKHNSYRDLENGDYGNVQYYLKKVIPELLV